jgi:hypothetical protein
VFRWLLTTAISLALWAILIAFCLWCFALDPLNTFDWAGEPRRRPQLFALFIFYCAILLILVVSWKLARSRQQRHRDGICAVCTYDLTGNVSGICPECRTPIKSKSMPEKNPGFPN